MIVKIKVKTMHVHVLHITVELQVFELGPDGGDNETDGELLAESDEMPYECGARLVTVSNEISKQVKQLSQYPSSGRSA